MDGGKVDGVGERALVLSASIASASLIAQHIAGKATRDSLFLTQFGIGHLPMAMMGAAVVSCVSMFLTARALARLGPARFVPAVFAISAALHAAEAALAGPYELATAVLVYLHSAILGAASVSAFWSLVSECFDPHAAKGAVGRIAGGGTLGGIVGGLVVWRAAPHVPIQAMLGLLAAANAVGLLGTLRLVRAATAMDRGAAAARASTATPSASESAVDVLRRTPYLRDLAVLVLAGAVLQALLDWLLSARAAEIFGKGAPLLGFFALFNVIVGVASFVAQTGLSRVLLERLGLARTARIQPAVTAGFAVLALLVPGAAAVFALRGAEAVSRNSFFRSAYELFYTPLPAAKKRPTKALIDVGFDRLGTAIASGALLIVASFAPEVATRVVLMGTVASCAVAVAISARLHAGYVTALADSLTSGAVALGNDDLVDLTTRQTLAETTAALDREQLLARIEEFQRGRAAAEASPPLAPLAPPAPLAPLAASALAEDALLVSAAGLRSHDPTRVRLELSSRQSPDLAPVAVPLLATDAVARDAVRALRRAGPSIHGMLVDRLLDPKSDVRVRRRLPRVLRAAAGELARSGLFLALRDPAFEVRQQAAVALAQALAPRPKEALTAAAASVGATAPRPLDREAVFDTVVHELTAGRATWGQDPARGVGHVFVVLGLVLDREPLGIALRALRGSDPALRGTAHEYLDVVLPARVLAALSPVLGLVERPAPPRAPVEIEEDLRRSAVRGARPEAGSR